MKYFKYLVLGTLFGIILTKSEVISWFRIQEMFRFQAFHMYGVIGSAMLVGMISIQLIKRNRLKSIDGEEIKLADKQFNHGIWIGGFIFGLGWALTGACPGPLFAQLHLADSVDAAASRLEAAPAGLLVIDLDVFKAYNDAHGHQAGDLLLCWVGEQLEKAVRPTDSVARLGGDEFAVLLPDTCRKTAMPVIERIEQTLERQTAHCLGRATAPDHGSMFDELYRAADSDLYERKLISRRKTAGQMAAGPISPEAASRN